MQAAVEREDYELAKQIKMDADRLRAAGEAAAGTAGHSPVRVGSHPDEIFNRVLQPQMGKAVSPPIKVLLCRCKVPFHSHVPVSFTDHEGSLFSQPPRTGYCNSRVSCAEGDQNTADNIPVSATESHMPSMDTGMQEGPWHEEVPAMAASMNTYVSEEAAAPVAVHPPAGLLPCYVCAHP